jgi:hypothetical protein
MRLIPSIERCRKSVSINEMSAKSLNGLVKDFGVGHFGDFEIDVESRANKTEAGALNLIFILSNSITPKYGDAASVYVGWVADETNSIQLILGRDGAIAESSTTEDLVKRKWYYLRVKRKAATNTITLQIYTHKSRVSSSLVESLSISYTSTAFRYLSVGAAGKVTGVKAKFTGDHRNLNLNEKTAYLNQSAFRFRRDNGNEASATWKTSENEPILNETDSILRIRTCVEAISFPIVEDRFSTLSRWAVDGSVMVTGGYLSCFISGGAGKDAVACAINECDECYYDSDYCWGVSGWSPGTSSYVMINALVNDDNYVAAFAINTSTGKVGVAYTSGNDFYGQWSDVSEELYGDNAFSRTRVYFKKATSGANGIIKLWYNDVLVIDLNDIDNAGVGKVAMVTAGNSYCDGDLVGDLYVLGIKVYKPSSFSGQLQLEWKPAVVYGYPGTDIGWKKVLVE